MALIRLTLKSTETDSDKIISVVKSLNTDFGIRLIKGKKATDWNKWEKNTYTYSFVILKELV